MSRIWVPTFALLLLAPSVLRAQENSNKWMLEVSYDGQTLYFEVPERGVDSGAGLTLSHDKAKGLLQSLQLRYWMADEGLVPLQVSIFSSSTDDSGPRSDSLIGNYMLHPNESITLSQLNDYGLKTATVKLVTAQPTGLTAPAVVNKTISLAVENVEVNRSGYKMQLRNISSIPVATIVLFLSSPTGACDVREVRSATGSGINSTRGMEVQFEIPRDRSAYLGPDEESCSPANSVTSESSHQTPKIVVDAAVFTDGSHEGDDSRAIMLDAQKTAIEIQKKRINSIVEATFGTAGTDDAAKMALLRSQVKGLSEEPEPEIIQSIIARYPRLPDDVANSIRRDVHDGLQIAKDMFLNELKQYADEISKRQIPSVSLRDWWNATNGQCVVAPCGASTIQSKLAN